MQSHADKVVRWIGVVATGAGALALLSIGALMTMGVITRFSGGMISGATEISEMLVIIMSSMSLLAATVYDAHPRVHMLVDRMTPRTRRLVGALVAALATGFWTIATFITGRVTIENARLVEETELLRLSVIPYRAIWTVSLAVLTLVLLIRAFRTPAAPHAARGGH